MVEKLVKEHGLALGELSRIVGMSKAWLSKRQTMARNLVSPLKEMIVRGSLCTRSAEEISKLPQEEQVAFAANASKEALNKDDICRLVKLYRSPDATLELCRAVVEAPSEALLACPKTEKPRAAYAKSDSAARLGRTARCAGNLLEGLCKMVCAADGAAIDAAKEHLLALRSKMLVAAKLIAASARPPIDPGKREGSEQ